MSERLSGAPDRRPIVELLLDPGVGSRLHGFVRALSAVARPLAPEHGVAPHGRLLSSPHAPEAHRAAGDRTPYAVVVEDPTELDHPIVLGAAAWLLVGGAATSWEDDDVRAIVLSPHPVDTRWVLPVPPHVRASLRARHGLPDDLVVRIGRPGAPSLGDDARRTALRLAAVVDVVGSSATEALALGAPVVTDAATATLLGATEAQVVVADAAGAAGAAASLVSDPARCARLGRAGRQLAETRHDLFRAARRLATLLDLVPASAHPAEPGQRLGARLTELGTPPGHPVEEQLAARLTRLDLAVRSGGC